MYAKIETHFDNSNKFDIYDELIWSKGHDYIFDLLYKLSVEYSSNKKIILFVVDDYQYPLGIYDNQIVVRTSICKSLKCYNELVLPYIFEPIEKFAPFNRIKKPVVSFCGLNSEHRQSTIKEFESSDNIQTNFILRDKFWGGKPHDPLVIDEFRENIKNSYYVICNRGAGNFSMRFYQVLSAGRIPVLLNTDIELPFVDIINWSEYIIMADTNEELVKKVLEHYDTVDIIEQQIKNAEMYEKYFTPDNYAKHLLNYLNNNF